MLLLASVLAPLPYPVLTMTLLGLFIFFIIHPRFPQINLAFIVAIIFLSPLALATLMSRLAQLPPITVHITSAVLITPCFYLLDHSLRAYACNIQIRPKDKTGRNTTSTYMSLFIAVLVLILLSMVVNRPVLLVTGTAFSLYLLSILLILFYTIPRLPLGTTMRIKRIIAGTSGNIPIRINSLASAGLHIYLDAVDEWVEITPQALFMYDSETTLNLGFKPPLSGQSEIQLRVSVLDSRGILQINQVLTPVKLHIIPRAKYAEWLAQKYLEQTGQGTGMSPALPNQVSIMPRRGIEYLDNRVYQAGDQLRDIDWKHSLKLSQLIVKEYIETGERTAIIAVNLCVTNAEESDKLAFNLITTALTLAREGIPTALTAYNNESIILNITTTSPEEILRKTMSLVGEIITVEPDNRRLETFDITRIRRNISRLKQAESEPARRLLNILKFEYSATEEASRNHPATLALLTATRQVGTPALILLVSELNHDTEALLVTAEKLSKRNFTTISVECAT